MRFNLAFGTFLALAAATCLAGTTGGQIGVQITLNGGGTGNAASGANSSSGFCTSSSGATAGSTSVQVECSANVYVNIVPVKVTAAVKLPAIGEFITTYRLTRDSALSDDCRRELTGISGQAIRRMCGLDTSRGQSDDSVAEADEGWNLEGRLYATDMHTGSAQAQTLARLKLKNSQGTLTALRVDRTNNRFETVEMLVSF